MRVLHNPIFKIIRNEINFRKDNHLQSLQVLLKDFDQEKCPNHLLTWRKKVGQRWGLRNIINQGIATQKLTKKNPTHLLK